MKIGEKIRYLRELVGLTQSQLAIASGLHPVSIRKYETNKMQPQLPQIEKIAAALNVSSNALIGLENSSIRLETVGDFMGLIISLCNSNIIRIDGERGDNDLLKPETVSIHFDNPLLLSLIKLSIDNGRNGDELFEPNILSFHIPNRFVLPELIKWEKMNYLYHNVLKDKESNPNEAMESMVSEIAAIKEMVELELQRSMIIIRPEGGISVKMTPDLSKFL